MGLDSIDSSLNSTLADGITATANEAAAAARILAARSNDILKLIPKGSTDDVIQGILDTLPI